MPDSRDMAIVQPLDGIHEKMDQFPRLLLVAPGLDGDQERLYDIKLLRDFLKEQGKHAGLLTQGHEKSGDHDSRADQAGLSTHFTDFWGSIRTLVREFPRHDVVHLFFSSDTSWYQGLAPAILLARFFGKKIVLSYRRNQVETDLEHSARWVIPLLRSCDRILASSRYAVSLFAKYDVTAQAVPLVIDTDMFSARSISTVQPKIIVARSLEKRNNVACAIEAFKLVKQKYPRTEMIIAGDGSQRRELENLTARENSNGVRFTGQLNVRRLAREFAHADVYVNSATIDGLPGSLLAALSVGLPVVTVNRGGIGEVITDRVNGLFIEQNEPPYLADKIIELVESPVLVQTLSQQAKTTSRAYHWSEVGKQWADIYRHL